MNPLQQKLYREIALRTGDIVHSLRASLDYLAYAVVPNPSTDTAFPVWRSDKIPIPTPTQYKGCVMGKVKGAPSVFIKVCLGLEPYFGGAHEGIRILDYLDIVDKHRLVIGAFASYERVNLDFGGMIREEFATMMKGTGVPAANVPEVRLSLIPTERFPLTDGYVLFNAPPRPHKQDGRAARH